jgi:hypothetical protein
MAEEPKIPDIFRAYEEGKHRRYNLLFAVNGGAFAVVQWFFGTADLKLRKVDLVHTFLGNLTVSNTSFLGDLKLWQLSLGMALFTTVMVVDVFLFGQKMSKEMPELGLFGRPGKLVLILIGALICAGWTLVSFGILGLALVIPGYVAIIAAVWIRTKVGQLPEEVEAAQ